MDLKESRLFILISVGGLVLLGIIAAVAFYLVAPRLEQFHPDLPHIILIAAAAAVVIIAFGLLLIANSALTGRRLIFGQRITSTVTRVLFPPVLMLATIMTIDRDRVKRSFIAVNNALVTAGVDRHKPAKLLLLLPHCLQATDCPHKITGGLIENCRRCGKCVIAELVELATENGLTLAVATGGTLARSVIREARPTGIIAVACETDLTSGIRDSYPLPVYGVLNRRPHGPCHDTTVEIDAVQDAIRMFTGERG